jgi:hypothetical protein
MRWLLWLRQCASVLAAFPTSIELDDVLLAASSTGLGPKLRQAAAVAARLDCKLKCVAALESFLTYEQVYI